MAHLFVSLLVFALAPAFDAACMANENSETCKQEQHDAAAMLQGSFGVNRAGGSEQQLEEDVVKFEDELDVKDDFEDHEGEADEDEMDEQANLDEDEEEQISAKAASTATKCDLLGCKKCVQCVASTMRRHPSCESWYKQSTEKIHWTTPVHDVGAPVKQLHCVNPSSAPAGCKHAVKCACQRGNAACYAQFFKSKCFCVQPKAAAARRAPAAACGPIKPPSFVASRLQSVLGGGDGAGTRPKISAARNECDVKQFVSLFGLDPMMERSSRQKENVSSTSFISEDIDSALAGKCAE